MGNRRRHASESVGAGSRLDAPRQTSWLGTSFVGWHECVTLARCDFQLLLRTDQQSSTQERLDLFSSVVSVYCARFYRYRTLRRRL